MYVLLISNVFAVFVSLVAHRNCIAFIGIVSSPHQVTTSCVITLELVVGVCALAVSIYWLFGSYWRLARRGGRGAHRHYQSKNVLRPLLSRLIDR